MNDLSERVFLSDSFLITFFSLLHSSSESIESRDQHAPSLVQEKKEKKMAGAWDGG